MEWTTSARGFGFASVEAAEEAEASSDAGVLPVAPAALDVTSFSGLKGD